MTYPTISSGFFEVNPRTNTFSAEAAEIQYGAKVNPLNGFILVCRDGSTIVFEPTGAVKDRDGDITQWCFVSDGRRYHATIFND